MWWVRLSRLFVFFIGFYISGVVVGVGITRTHTQTSNEAQCKRLASGTTSWCELCDVRKDTGVAPSCWYLLQSMVDRQGNQKASASIWMGQCSVFCVLVASIDILDFRWWMAQICFTGRALLPKTDTFVLPVPLQLVQSKWRIVKVSAFRLTLRGEPFSNICR